MVFCFFIVTLVTIYMITKILRFIYLSLLLPKIQCYPIYSVTWHEYLMHLSPALFTTQLYINHIFQV
jgi:hypothetical protein